MKKIFFVFVLSLMVVSLTGCNWAAKQFGGEVTIKLDPGQKLENITWKDNNIWTQTRPMEPDEKAETHTFTEHSNAGVLEGKVTVIEQEKE